MGVGDGGWVGKQKKGCVLAGFSAGCVAITRGLAGPASSVGVWSNPRSANPKTENPLDRCAAVLRYPAASDILRNSTQTDRFRNSERAPFGRTPGLIQQAETPTPIARHRAPPTRFRHDPRICDTPCRASVAWMRVISSIINDNAGRLAGRRGGGQAGRRAVGQLGG